MTAHQASILDGDAVRQLHQHLRGPDLAAVQAARQVIDRLRFRDDVLRLCLGELPRIGTPPTCISNCWRNWAGPTKCLLLPVENRPSLAAVMAVLSGGLRRAACPSEIAVIEPPTIWTNEALAHFTRQNLTHDEHGITYIESA